MITEPETPTTTRPRGGARPGSGRPTAQEAERRRLAAVGADPAALDPMRVMAALAADPRVDPIARVLASVALAMLRPTGGA